MNEPTGQLGNTEPVDTDTNMDMQSRALSSRGVFRIKERSLSPDGETMTRSEARRYTWNALLAALLIALVLSVVWILFTLFATNIWLH